MRIARDAFKIRQIAGLADQQTQIGAFGGKRPSHMMAYKSGRPS